MKVRWHARLISWCQRKLYPGSASNASVKLMTLLYACTENGSLVGLGTGLLADIAASIRVGMLSYYNIYLVRLALFLLSSQY